jgi:hypothetical protein
VDKLEECTVKSAELSEALTDYFISAFNFCTSRFLAEVAVVEERMFEGQTAWDFYLAYVWVVVNSGMKNTVAERIYWRFRDSDGDLAKIGHPGKQQAITTAQKEYSRWFSTLQSSSDKLAYLESLPWIGAITKYHLARNLGLDCAKPDRHLTRIAQHFGYADVQAMCQVLAAEFGLRVGTVDVILWRFMVSHGSGFLDPHGSVRDLQSFL